MQIEEGSIKIEIVERAEHLIIYQYSRTRFGGWVKQGHVMFPRTFLSLLAKYTVPAKKGLLSNFNPYDLNEVAQIDKLIKNKK